VPELPARFYVDVAYHAQGPSPTDLTVGSGGPYGSQIQYADPLVAMVAYGVTTRPDCVGGFGSATCEYADSLSFYLTDGADKLTVQSAPRFGASIHAAAGDDHITDLVGYDFIYCGDGYDVVVTRATDIVSTDCEDVTRV